jgi:hypothetical protein
MTNPAPRPALRKAPDADVHPASQQTPQEIDLRNRQASVPEREALPAVEPASLGKHDQVVVLPATSPKVDEQPAETVKKSHKKSPSKKNSSKKTSFKKNVDAKKVKKQDKKQEKRKDKIKKEKDKEKKKSKGKKSSATSHRIDLRTKVPTSVRRTLRSSAKARGTSVEDNVDSVLTGWRPNPSN